VSERRSWESSPLKVQTEMRSRKETKGPGEVGDRRDGRGEERRRRRRRRKQQNTDRIETRFKDSSTSEGGKQKNSERKTERKTDRQTDRQTDRRRRKEKNLHTEGQKKRE